MTIGSAVVPSELARAQGGDGHALARDGRRRRAAGAAVDGEGGHDGLYSPASLPQPAPPLGQARELEDGVADDDDRDRAGQRGSGTVWRSWGTRNRPLNWTITAISDTSSTGTASLRRSSSSAAPTNPTHTAIA